jgi:hypothetical protein
MALVAILLCLLLAAPALATECEIIDSEFTVLDNSLNSPTSAVLDASGSPVQLDPSSQSYLVDGEYGVVDVTTSRPSSVVLDASGSPVQSNPSSQSYLIDTEYSVADVTTSRPTSAVLDASTSPVQSDPSSQSYIIDAEYSLADVTTDSPSSDVLDASGSPVQSDPSSQSYLIDTEYSVADVTTSSPSSTILDASGAPVQSDPSSQSYLVDTEFTVLDGSEFEPWSGADYFYCYPTSAFPGEGAELTVVVKLTEISMRAGDPVQWYITTPGGETITGESDGLKCCIQSCLYDTAYYDFPEYGTYTVRVEFSGYTQYAEWTVEVWGPTGVIIGEVSNPTNDPVENVDVYLYDTEDEYKVLNFIDEWRSDPTASVPSYISSTKTDGAGKYQLTEIIPGSYIVLAVPQFESGLSVTASGVCVIEKDETDTINLRLTPRYLNFDKVMDAIKSDSTDIVDEDTGAAAEVYVKGWNEFTEHELPENLFWSALSGITLAVSIYSGDVPSVGRAVTSFANELGVTLVGIPLLEEAAKVQWQKEGPGDYELAKEAAIEVKNLNWMRDFEYAAEGSDVAEEEGYIKRTNIYPETVTSIDRSFEDYLDLTYLEPAEGFDSSEVKAILQQQEEMLRDARGFAITPQGNIFNLKETIIHKEGYEGAKTIADTAGIAGKASTVLSAAGLAISIGTSWTIAGVGVGAAVSGFGAAGGLASATIETTAIELMADEWGNTQLYWAKDLGEIQEVNRDIVEWLDEEMQHPTDYKNINGEIVSTDLHPDPLVKWLLGINVIEPNEPWFSPIKVFALKDEDVVIRNTGSIDDVSIIVLNYNYLLDGTTSKHGGVVRSTLDAGESKSIKLPYMSDFILPLTMEYHFLQTILWTEGKINQKTDEYIVVGDIDWILRLSSPLASSLATETSVQDMREELMKQPMRSNSCTFSTSTSNSPVTVEEWVNLVGNCTKIISTTIDPTNDSIRVKYTTNASTKNITLFMTTIPGSHLNLHVHDELGRHVGYFPVTDSDQIQIPNATYTGNVSNPEIILIPDAASKNYTIKVDATQFTSSSPIPVEVYAIETPVRPAVLGISPVELYPFISPGETKNITMQLAEVGKQVGIEDVTISPHGFTDKFGNPIPDVTTILSQNNFDISAGNTTSLIINISVPESITLPDVPETRYTGNITIETLNAGSINSTIHLLVLATDLSNAKLTFAEPDVAGVHLSSIDLSDVNETYKPAEVTPQSAYRVNSTGAGNFTLQFTDIPDADTITAYKINTTNHWIPLNTITTTDNVTFMMSVEDKRVVFASIEGMPDITYTISLNHGWNLISAPLNLPAWMLGDESVVGDPLNVTPENSLTSIYRYNTTSESFEKCTHYAGWGWAPATGSESFTELEPGRGYWVMAENDCDLTFTGTAPSDLDVPLDADWNCVGWYLTSAALLGEEAVVGDPLSVTPENSLTSIYRYNSSTGLFEKCSHYADWGWYPATGSESFTELEPGRGYWVMAENEGIWGA